LELSQLKKLSDLRKEHQQITTRLEENWNQSKEEIINQAQKSFRNFFAETEFDIHSSEDDLKASYDSINIILTDSQNDPGIKSGPYYLTFELKIDMDEPQETTYKIPVDEYNQTPVLKKKFRVRQYCSDTVSGKIERIERSISEIEDMIADFAEVDLGFAKIKDTTSSKNILENKDLTLEYEKFKNVLADIFS
jgi:hypothetical protein